MSVDTLDTRRTGANGSARPTGGLLAHIPGDDGWPFVGHTLAIVADYRGFVERRVQRYGMVHRGRAFGHANVTMLGPEANELVFLDPQKQFSSALGWGIVLDKLFPRGLMLLDFDEHRVHRRVLSVAFKADPMRSYLAGLNAGIAKGLAQWPRRRGFKFYPAIKQLTLDLAATSFLGGELGPELEAVKRAFIAMVAASISVIRAPLPGTRFSRGVRGRALLADYFNRQIPLRRERGGDDLFSQLCRATWEDGTLLSNADIVGHMNFLMMAAHDTLTSSLTAFVDRLAADPDWQEKLRAEHRGLGLARRRALAVRAPRRSRAHRDGVQGSAAADAAGAVDPAARIARVRVQRLPHPGQRRGERQPDLHPLHAATMARPGALRSDALYAGGDARPAQIRLRPLWRRRPYVPRAAFCLHAGQVLHLAFPQQFPRRG